MRRTRLLSRNNDVGYQDTRLRRVPNDTRVVRPSVHTREPSNREYRRSLYAGNGWIYRIPSRSINSRGIDHRKNTSSFMTYVPR